MSYYAGIGAVRIQPWLAQTSSKLFLVRGASHLLSEGTGNARIAGWLRKKHPKVRLAESAGDVAGVVALTSEDEGLLKTACEQLVAKLEQEIAGLQWSVWLVEADSYLDAYAKQHGKPAWLESFPALPELGLVRSCTYCGVETALRSINHGDEQGLAGISCLQRNEAYLQQEKQRKEDDRWGKIAGRWPKDFEQLARDGGTSRGVSEVDSVGRTSSRSHLATIAADGNGIGELFSQIAELGDGALRRQAVKELDEATNTAVIAAAEACLKTEDGGQSDVTVKVALPHYVGGDDVLVSVPAPFAWQFAVALGREFERLRGRLLELAPADAPKKLKDAIGRLGLGVGIAFAPLAHPIARTSELAHVALTSAKAATWGGESAIGWVDVTSAAEQFFTITVAEAELELSGADRQLEEQSKTRRVNPVFLLAPTARGVLGTIMHANYDNPETKLANWCKRTGNNLGDITAAELPAHLSRARWWPNVVEDEFDEDELAAAEYEYDEEGE